MLHSETEIYTLSSYVVVEILFFTFLVHSTTMHFNMPGLYSFNQAINPLIAYTHMVTHVRVFSFILPS